MFMSVDGYRAQCRNLQNHELSSAFVVAEMELTWLLAWLPRMRGRKCAC